MSGRKREFDEEIVLAAAMDVFWQKGYVGSSLSDLTASMGINKPSLYRAFGNKEALFIKATKHYVDVNMKQHIDCLFEENVPLIDRLRNYMLSVISLQCATDNPKGCYLVACQSELISGEIPSNAVELLKELDELPLVILHDFFNTDKESQALGLDETKEVNALSIYTVLKGTASMARSGIETKQLEAVVDRVLKGLFS